MAGTAVSTELGHRAGYKTGEAQARMLLDETVLSLQGEGGTRSQWGRRSLCPPQSECHRRKQSKSPRERPCLFPGPFPCPCPCPCKTRPCPSKTLPCPCRDKPLPVQDTDPAPGRARAKHPCPSASPCKRCPCACKAKQRLLRGRGNRRQWRSTSQTLCASYGMLRGTPGSTSGYGYSRLPRY